MAHDADIPKAAEQTTERVLAVCAFLETKRFRVPVAQENSSESTWNERGFAVSPIYIVRWL